MAEKREFRTQTITVFGRMYMIDTDKITVVKATGIIRDLSLHEWANKKDKEFAIKLVAQAFY
jgi:hypothetical protein